MEAYALRRKFEFCSPVLTIQKTIRMFIARKSYIYKRSMIRIMAWALKRWALRHEVETWVEKIGLSRQWLHNIGRVRFIQRTWRKLSRKWHLKLKTVN